MRVCSLGSGSRGNGLVISDGEQALLVDCGFGPRAVATRLAQVGVQPEQVVGLVLTHEHQDHAQGAARAQHKWRWPVYASAGTLSALGEIPARWGHAIVAGTPTAIEGFTVDCVSIPHDAAAPIAVAVGITRSGARVAVAHDLGAVPEGLHAAFAQADVLCVEANHDEEMLRQGPYPPMLQQRIRGGRGHISNAQAAALLASLAHRHLQGVFLLHLSETNNTPTEAEGSVRRTLRRAGYTRALQAAAGRTPHILFNGAATRGTQLSLSL